MNSEEKLQQARNSILPNGDLIVYKKCSTKGGIGSVIVKLLIPKDALRVNSPGERKCRASKAVVLSIGGKSKVAYSTHDYKFKYEVGKTVRPTNGFNRSRAQTCSSGIHFYITREEAVAH